jgi:hypothetical protein
MIRQSYIASLANLIQSPGAVTTNAREQHMNWRNIGWILVGLIAVGALLVGARQGAATQDPSSIDGVWEGPWYRGMTSGKVRIDLNANSGTIQFTNLDNFGPELQRLQKVAAEGSVLKFQAEGDKGGLLSASLHLNDAGTQMKGMGKFDGFPLRFEVKRTKQP